MNTRFSPVANVLDPHPPQSKPKMPDDLRLAQIDQEMLEIQARLASSECWGAYDSVTRLEDVVRPAGHSSRFSLTL